MSYTSRTLELALKQIDPNKKLVLEFGVHSGESIKKIRNTLDPSYEIWGFDTFTGLPEDWVGTNLKKGFFDMGGKFPQIEITHGKIKLFKGLFSDTLPPLIDEGELQTRQIGLIHVDCDLYSSTKDIFNCIGRFIEIGTVIVFDEWHYNYDITCNDHEQKAFKEWIVENSRAYEFLDISDSEVELPAEHGWPKRPPQQKAVKITK
jgi:hypothetical protein